MKKIIWVSVLLAGAMGCSSTGNKVSHESAAEVMPDKVVSRIDNLSERPNYIQESKPFRIENGNVISMGMTTIPASNRVEAAYRIAQNNAKAAIAGAIEQRLEFIFQNAEEGTSVDATQARYIGAEASRLVTSSIHPDKLYWEKVATSSDSGERLTQYKVFAIVTMPEANFKKAIIDAARRAQGKGGLSEDFANKVNQHWDKFANSDDSQRTPTAATASANKTKDDMSEKNDGENE